MTKDRYDLDDVEAWRRANEMGDESVSDDKQVELFALTQRIEEVLGVSGIPPRQIGALIASVGLDVVNDQIEAWKTRDVSFVENPISLFISFCRKNDIGPRNLPKRKVIVEMSPTTPCPWCRGTGHDPEGLEFDHGRPLPEKPEEVDEFLSRRFGKLRRAAARRGNHLVSATSATGFRSAGARQFDEAELAFIRVALALLERYAGELSEARSRR